jgi:hypothetical protein
MKSKQQSQEREMFGQRSADLFPRNRAKYQAGRERLVWLGESSEDPAPEARLD